LKEASLIAVTVDGAIGQITLNRPDKRNALNRAMWRAIPSAVATLQHDPAVRVILLKGEGAHFAGGADIAEFDEVYATRDSAAAYAADLGGAMNALCACDKPCLAVIRGACIGGGVALTLCCDQRFADDTAYFAVPPARLGIAYAFEDTRRLVQTIGAAASRDLLFSARTIDAAEAHRLRLVDRLCSAETLQDQALAYAAALCAASRESVRVARDFIERACEGQIWEDDATRAAYLDVFDKADFREGKAAFREKRKPRFE
jgi:enoyl-CoA hydratase/carnithine racemase